MIFSTVFSHMQISLDPETAKDGSEAEIPSAHNCPGAHLEFTITVQARHSDGWSAAETGGCGSRRCMQSLCVQQSLSGNTLDCIFRIWGEKRLDFTEAERQWMYCPLGTSCIVPRQFTEIRLPHTHLKLHNGSAALD